MSEEYEQWRIIDGFEGYYEVSNLGRVRSLARKDSIGRAIGGLILRLNLNSKGYLQVALARDGRNRSFAVHRLVTKAFIGSVPNEHEVDHIDGNKRNNCVDNLRYVTRRQNIQGAVARRSLKLSDAEAIEIRRLAMEGMSHRRIATEFNVSHSHVGKIVRRERQNSK